MPTTAHPDHAGPHGLRTPKFEDTLMHGRNWGGQCVDGWYWSEKLDGCRARWTGEALLSRGGHLIALPPQIAATLPQQVALDLEVYAGPGCREAARQAVQLGRWAPNVRLVCFDYPHARGDWLARIGAAQRLPGLEIVRHGVASDAQDLLCHLRSVQGAGGEGLMVHAPGQAYVHGRTNALLKVKDQAVFSQEAA